MPVRVQSSLPAIEELKKENIFVIDECRASTQDIRPLRIAILNLMPLKLSTETDLLRLISNTPLQITLDLVLPTGHQWTNTPKEHLDIFYKTFDEIRDSNYDGFIVTGAPVEMVEFEEVDYWPELTEIFSWAKTHVTSTIYICWAAFAGMYYNYGIPKQMVDHKIFGIFPHRVLDKKNPLARGFDDLFYVPHSRHCTISDKDINRHPELHTIAESPESGPYIIMARKGRDIYITGHSEYSPMTLDSEFRRDKARGLNPDIPHNYYPDNNPDASPIVQWRSHANLLFSNWLNYFVYQETPYDISNIK